MKIIPENITHLRIRIKEEDIQEYIFNTDDEKILRGNDLTIGEIIKSDDVALYYKGKFYTAWVPLCHLEFVDTVDIKR